MRKIANALVSKVGARSSRLTAVHSLHRDLPNFDIDTLNEDFWSAPYDFRDLALGLMKLVWVSGRHRMFAGCLAKAWNLHSVSLAHVEPSTCLSCRSVRAFAYRHGLTTSKIRACEQVTGLPNHKADPTTSQR